MIHIANRDYLNPPRQTRWTYLLAACMGLIPVAILIAWCFQ